MSEVESTEIIYKKALRLAKLDKEFKLIKVNNTFQLESDYFGKSISKRSARINPVELGFIKKVKNHVMRNEVYTNFVTNFYSPSDVRYISIRTRPPGTIINDVVEIDIDEAYWKTALILGVIDQKIYEEGSKKNTEISKATRLIALGSLAKKVDEYIYKGNTMVKHKQIRSELTENIWYSICKTVSDAMWAARKIAGHNFFLFWVDGIYIKNDPKKIKAIQEVFESYGYDVKFKYNLQIEYTEKTALVKNLETDKARPFYLPKNVNHKRYFPDDELKETCFKYMKYGIVDDEL